MIATCNLASAQRRHWLIVIVVLVALVVTPYWLPLLKLPPPGLNENRTLSDAPGLPSSWRQVVSFPSALDAYVQDHFPPRTYFIEALNYLRYKLGYSPIRDVVVAKDGWLFYNANNVNYYHHRGLWRLQPAALKAWVENYQEFTRQLESRGIDSYLLFAPEKPSIYPEMLPDWWPLADTTAVEDIRSAVPDDARKLIVYPKTALLEEKKRRPVYGPYDTHWNAYGAYVAYHALLSRISKADSRVESPKPLSAFKLSELARDQVPHDLAKMLGIGRGIVPVHPTAVTYPMHDLARTRFLTEGTDWWHTQVIETDAHNDLTLLLIRDSFTIEMLPFLKAHFKNIVLAHSQSGFVRPDLVDQFKPDVVVIEVIESRVVNAF